MGLPKIQHPILLLNIPSTKKKIKLRPILVKEEKILLMAKLSEDPNDIFMSIKQIVNNCILDEDVDIDKISLFDLEYLFLKLRAFSIDNIIKLTIRDVEDEELYDFEIDLTKVEVKFPENISTKVEITDKTGIVLSYPKASLYSDKDFLNEADQSKQLDLMILSCVDKIYDEDSVYPVADYNKEELLDFIENLPVPVYGKINEFLQNQPTISHEINYKNSKGNDRKYELTKLDDFFMLR